MKTLYPDIQPFRTWWLNTSDGHEVCVYESGTPSGQPLLYVHGGPGGGISPSYGRYFDPKHFHVILVDQRGCGQSRPLGRVENNTTWNLITDFENIRKELGIKQWTLWGGSWGTALSLAYAQTHPDVVTAIVLRAVYLARKEDLEWTYKFGMKYVYPEQYEKFLAVLPEKDREDVVNGYYKLFQSGNWNKELEAARNLWALSLRAISLYPQAPDRSLVGWKDDEKMHAAGKIANHYQYHRYFFDEKTALLNNAYKIAHIPVRIIHGRVDMLCPYRTAFTLHRALSNSTLIEVPDACHSSLEPGIVHHLIEASEWLKTFEKP